MRIIADLHIHSKYSRGCSKDLNIENLEKWARIKGIGLLGTGDFTHPEWEIELKQKLTDDGKGILKTKTGFPFILQTEVSLVYSQDGKGRRVHVVILAPSFNISDKITNYFKDAGRVDYDGRPIFKISAKKLTADLKEISDEIEIIPAHIWTPWFSLFGSKSGFDDIKQAFGEQIRHIYALETGISSDPLMNYHVSQLDRFQMVSFSDCHSYWPWRLGREATVFDIELTYKNLINAIRTGDGLVETIEVDPNYGKYHFDGHRNCGICFSPKETFGHKGICPLCKKPLTIGVQYRVDELSDRETTRKINAKPFKTIIPLHEIISKVIESGINTKKTWEIYNLLIDKFKTEFNVLLDAKKSELKEIIDGKLVDAIILNRKGKIKVIPGYDGEYGILILSKKDIPKKKVMTIKQTPQKDLLDF